MTDMTLTFTALSSQSKVTFVDDPSQPGWDDFPSADNKDRKAKTDDDKERKRPQSRG